MLEKQLKTVKQERNALATTLRQHGFLGKQCRSSTAVQPSTPDHQSKHILLGICRQATPADCITENHPAASELTANAADSHRRPHSSINVFPLQSSPQMQVDSDAAETNTLRDVTNVMPSSSTVSSAITSAHVAPHASPIDSIEFIGQTCQLAEKQGHISQQPSASSHASTQAMQARLHELKQLAQDLLL